MTDSNTPGRQAAHVVAGPPPQPTLLAGRYRLGRRIGQGGMADVFAATDEVLHRPVAVKVFRFDGEATQDRARIQTEVRLLASLSHPNLVTVYDASTDGMGPDGRAFIVMELVTGHSLRERLVDGPLDAHQAAALGVGISTALNHVHGQGIVHRDVKPANILLAVPSAGVPGEFTAKLADFGIARLLDATRVTMVGTTIGTANYLSPEQVEGRDVGPTSDVYSLGLVLIESLTGQVAYPGSGVEAALARLHRQPTIPTEPGPAWVELLEAMTDQSAELRPSAADVRAALTPLTADGASTSPLAPTKALPVGHPATTPPASRDDHRVPTTPERTRTLDTARPNVVAEVFRTRPKWAVYAGAALAIVLAALVLSLVFTNRSATPTPAPAYPNVPGQLGRDLHELQKAVG